MLNASRFVDGRSNTLLLRIVGALHGVISAVYEVIRRCAGAVSLTERHGVAPVGDGSPSALALDEGLKLDNGHQLI